MIKQLLNPDGTLKTWDQFRKDAKPFLTSYNQNWLQAEYQTAIASSRMAIKWQDIQRRKHLYPNLKYRTVHDDRVRPEHVALDGIVRPVDDFFWKTHYPPNGWRCRCTVEQTREKENDLHENQPMPDTDFANNVGETGLLWGDNHPYFDAATLNNHYVQSQAKDFFAKKTRTEVKQWATETIANSQQWTLPQLPMAATITKSEIKHLLATPHKNAATRNQILYVLGDILKTATFVGTAKSKEGKHEAVILWYYYHTIINGEDYFFNFRHIKTDENTERIGLYAITDNL